MEGYFIFKGIDSRDMGVLIAAMPDIVKPERRAETLTIPGRSGTLTLDEGCYDAYTLRMECGLRGTERLAELAAWLDGSGELILSTEPERVYRARISNAISIADVIYLYSTFLVQFDVFPFKYSVNRVDEELSLTAAATIYNRGTVYAEPTITVYGSGRIFLTINDEIYRLLDVEEYMTIDSERMEAYKGQQSCNHQFGALEFPRLAVGENKISWTGNVTRVDIEPKWRWL